MKLESLHDLFALKIMALYDIESEIVKALPKMAKAATDPDLRQSFLDHLEETRGHVERLEAVFSEIGMKPKKTKVMAIRGLKIPRGLLKKSRRQRPWMRDLSRRPVMSNIMRWPDTCHP